MNCSLTQTFQFSALHTLHQPQLSAEENLKNFAYCEQIHGHDYKLEVTWVASIDKNSGLIIDRDEARKIVQDRLIKKVDKMDLNKVFPVTTGEVLIQEMFKILKNTPLGPKLKALALQETRKNRFVLVDGEF